jgi:D-glycerate 3-kinase
VPGTHDLALADAVISALDSHGPVAVPRFDKAVDDRSPVLRDGRRLLMSCC